MLQHFSFFNRCQLPLLSASKGLLTVSMIAGLLSAVIDPNPTLANSPGSSSPSSFPSLVEGFRRRLPPPRGSRGGPCWIAPGFLEGAGGIWSDRPLFLWQTSGQARVKTVMLLQPDSEEILWQKTVPDQAESLTYDGVPLQAGARYELEVGWQFWDTGNQRWQPQRQIFSLRRLATTEQQRVTAALAQLNKADRSQTGEARALLQAQYLIDQGLLSDGLQVLYGLQPASPSIKSVLQQLKTSVCQSDT